MNTTIFYHKNCNDGYIAALVAYSFFKEQNMLDTVEFIPVQYNEPLPEEETYEGRVVYILDFSFSKEDTTKIIEAADSVIMLDHHETARKNLFTGERFLEGSVVETDDVNGSYILHTKTASITVDKKESGATLAYQHWGILIEDLDVRERLLYLSDHAKDRDLWKFELKDTKAVYEYSSTMGFNLETGYDYLVSVNMFHLDDQIELAQVRVDMRDELAKGYANKAHMIKFMGYTVPCVNVASNFASVVGDLLGKDHPFAIMFVVTKDKLILSLRSNQITGVNVEAIAKKLGGGGHVNAAGCSLPINWLRLLMNGSIDEKLIDDTTCEPTVPDEDYGPGSWKDFIKHLVLFLVTLLLLLAVIYYPPVTSQDIVIPDRALSKML